MSTSGRRRFLRAAAAAAAGIFAVGSVREAPATAEVVEVPPVRAANDKMNLAVIGCGGQGSGHVGKASTENLVALCDVDERRAAGAFDNHRKAEKFHDFRVMFDKMHRQIDAVFIATPDHTHAPAAIAAMKLGKHVYCEKPLAHSIYECRLMAKVAREQKVATQMGNQAHANSKNRQLVEIIRSGVIGSIREAHAWCPKNFSADSRPKDTPAVPASLKWDVWLGPALDRPYHPNYLPFMWRGWADFGTGGLGDMACHVLDPVFWGLELQYPTTIETTGEPKENPEGFSSHLTVKYQFPKRGDAAHQQPVTVCWHHGNHVPQRKPVPRVELPANLKLPSDGVMLIGDKGIIIGDRGPGLIALLPREKFMDFQPPEPTLPRGKGHTEEWLAACRGGHVPLSNFQYAAMLTETVLLGNVAWRVGKKLEWDAVNMKATNCPEADRYLRREYRKGWEL